VSVEHGHGHADHSHGVSADADAGKLAVALGLILGFMALEIAVGVIAHSLALLSDAGHMLTDAAAIGLSLVAARLAVRPAKGALTYGFKILSAQANGVTLLILAAPQLARLAGELHGRATLVGVDWSDNQADAARFVRQPLDVSRADRFLRRSGRRLRPHRPTNHVSARP